MNKISIFIVAASLLVGLFFSINPDLNVYIFSAVNGYLPNKDVWLTLTVIGDGSFIGCFFYLLFRNNYELLARGLVAGLITTITSNSIKKFFEVIRPEHVISIDEIMLLGPAIEKTSYSMPSGHTMAIFMAIGFISKARTLTASSLSALTILGVFVMLSRIVIGVHWPSDCLIGLGLGLLIGLNVFSIKIDINSAWLRYLILLFYFIFSSVAIFMSIEYVSEYPVPSIFLAAFAFLSGLLILHDGKKLYAKRCI